MMIINNKQPYRDLFQTRLRRIISFIRTKPSGNIIDYNKFPKYIHNYVYSIYR